MKVPLSTQLCSLWGRCPASPHSNSQPCKAGQLVSLTTYCLWATGFYFDGKKDITLTRAKKSIFTQDKWYRITMWCLKNQAASSCHGHQVPFAGHGISLGLQFHWFLKAMGWDGSPMVAGADSRKVNTGHKEGALVYLEKLLRGPQHWFICMLHLCSEPLRVWWWHKWPIIFKRSHWNW